MQRHPHSIGRGVSGARSPALFFGVGAAPASVHAQGYGYDGYERRSYDDRVYDDGYEDYDTSDGASEPYDAAADDEDEWEDGEEVPDVSYFYDELEGEGRWIEHPRYGMVWIPYGVDREWRPYTRGRWSNTEEYGWYWVSDEPFGWATYHYGRWFFDDRYGWVWVPGTRWAPAWVAWRSSDDYVGWAPLPPESYWEPRAGLRYDATIYESPRFSIYWSFIQPLFMTTPAVYRHCRPRHEVETIVYRTRPQTSYVIVNRRIVNRGVSVTTIETITRSRITTVRISSSNDRAFRKRYRDDGAVIHVFRPKLTRFNAKRDRKPGKTVVFQNVLRDVDKRKVKVKRVKAVPHHDEPAKGATGTRSLAPGADPIDAMRGGNSVYRNEKLRPKDDPYRVKPGMDAYERARLKALREKALREEALREQKARQSRSKAKAAAGKEAPDTQKTGGGIPGPPPGANQFSGNATAGGTNALQSGNGQNDGKDKKKKKKKDEDG